MALQKVYLFGNSLVYKEGSTIVATIATNATHTGEVTGDEALTINKTAITGKTAVTAVGADYVLISDSSDSGNLKKALASDFMVGGGGGGSSNGYFPQGW